jgi:hypothetical protein
VPQSLVGNFRYFGPCGAGFGRRSLLAAFQFPFRRCRDRFDNGQRAVGIGHIHCDDLAIGSEQVRGETAASLLPGKRLMIGDTIAPVSEVLGAESEALTTIWIDHVTAREIPDLSDL